MFEQVEAAPPDPIIGLTEAFKNDTHPEKINLGVGVYKDQSGVTPILECVKEAERTLVSQETTKSYLAIDGSPDYGRYVRELFWGASHPLADDPRVSVVQAPGGTGALRVAGNFLHKVFPDKKIWMSSPTWANHSSVFQAAGLDTENYPYFDTAKNILDFDATLQQLESIPTGDAVLLHACCHNPTGVDPNRDQWQRMADVLVERELLPLVDFAYQGFGDGLEEDAAGLRILSEVVPEMLICSSFSKNFGLYRERVGALTIVAASAKAAAATLSQVKATVRANYSNPPAHGAAIVNAVLSSKELRSQWEQELAGMRKRINEMRRQFVETMQAKGANRDFSFIQAQRGMFSFSGLTPEQVDQLRERYSIYIVRSGRINVAGITPGNLGRLCDAIVSVLT